MSRCTALLLLYRSLLKALRKCLVAYLRVPGSKPLYCNARAFDEIYNVGRSFVTVYRLVRSVRRYASAHLTNNFPVKWPGINRTAMYVLKWKRKKRNCARSKILPKIGLGIYFEIFSRRIYALLLHGFFRFYEIHFSRKPLRCYEYNVLTAEPLASVTLRLKYVPSESQRYWNIFGRIRGVSIPRETWFRRYNTNLS